MNTKRFILAGIVVFIVYEILNYLIHILILGNAYMATASLWRPMEEMNSLMWILWLADLAKSFLFVFIFTKGIEGKGWAEGLRYGFWIGLYVSIGMAFGQFATSPIPFSLAIQWLIFGVLQLMICGVGAAVVYKK